MEPFTRDELEARGFGEALVYLDIYCPHLAESADLELGLRAHDDPKRRGGQILRLVAEAPATERWRAMPTFINDCGRILMEAVWYPEVGIWSRFSTKYNVQICPHCEKDFSHKSEAWFRGGRAPGSANYTYDGHVARCTRSRALRYGSGI